MTRPRASSQSCIGSKTYPTSRSAWCFCTSTTWAWPQGSCAVAICWLNLPRSPLEASGTSGMKAAINGGLHLSVLDGWWAEALMATTAGHFPAMSILMRARRTPVTPSPGDLFEREVAPAFFDRDANELPRSWLARIRASIRTLARGFCTGRMLDDYTERIYAPATSQLSR